MLSRSELKLASLLQTEMYELYDPMTVMFFYRNKHIMIGESASWA